MFIVFHSVLSSQPINGETFVLSLESIPHDLSHIYTEHFHQSCIVKIIVTIKIKIRNDVKRYKMSKKIKDKRGITF